MPDGVDASWGLVSSASGLVAPAVAPHVAVDDAPPTVDATTWSTDEALEAGVDDVAGGELVAALIRAARRESASAATPTTVTVDENVDRESGAPDDLEFVAADGSGFAVRVVNGQIEAKVIEPGDDAHDDASGTGWLPLAPIGTTRLVLDVGDTPILIGVDPAAPNMLMAVLPGDVSVTNDGRDLAPFEIDGLIDMPTVVAGILDRIAVQLTDARVADGGVVEFGRLRGGAVAAMQVADGIVQVRLGGGTWQPVSDAGSIATGSGVVSWQLDRTTGELAVTVPGLDEPLSSTATPSSMSPTALTASSLDELMVGLAAMADEHAPAQLRSDTAGVWLESPDDSDERDALYFSIDHVDGVPVPMVTSFDAQSGSSTARRLPASGELTLESGAVVEWQLVEATDGGRVSLDVRVLDAAGTERASATTGAESTTPIGFLPESALDDARGGVEAIRGGARTVVTADGIDFTTDAADGEPQRASFVPGEDGEPPYVLLGNGIGGPSQTLLAFHEPSGERTWAGTTIAWSTSETGELTVTVDGQPFTTGGQSGFAPSLTRDVLDAMRADTSTFLITDLAEAGGLPFGIDDVLDGVRMMRSLGGEFLGGLADAFVGVAEDAWQIAQFAWDAAKEIAGVLGEGVSGVLGALTSGGEALLGLFDRLAGATSDMHEGNPMGSTTAEVGAMVRGLLKMVDQLTGATKSRVIGRLTGEVLLSFIPAGMVRRAVDVVGIGATTAAVANEARSGEATTGIAVFAQVLVSRMFHAFTGMEVTASTGARIDLSPSVPVRHAQTGRTMTYDANPKHDLTGAKRGSATVSGQPTNPVRLLKHATRIDDTHYVGVERLPDGQFELVEFRVDHNGVAHGYKVGTDRKELLRAGISDDVINALVTAKLVRVSGGKIKFVGDSYGASASTA